MIVRIGDAAKTELEEAIDWYEAQAKGLGKRFLAEIDKAVLRIIKFPNGHRELVPGFRRCLVNTFPFGVVYSAEPECLWIVAIGHLHRRPLYWTHRNA